MSAKRKKTEKRVTYEVERESFIFGWVSTGFAGYTTQEAAEAGRESGIRNNDLDAAHSRIVKVTREVVR